MKRKRIFAAVFALSLLCVLVAAAAGEGGKEIAVVYPRMTFGYQTEENVTAYTSTEHSEPAPPEPGHPVVNINTAGAEELAAVLPGIGKVKAQRIVEYREAVGGFMSVDELTEVYGIGPSTLEKIRPYCVIE